MSGDAAFALLSPLWAGRESQKSNTSSGIVNTPVIASRRADATVDQSAAEFQHQTLVGDELYRQMQILRARMAPPEQWPGRVRRFAEAWTEWKRRLRLSDFTDLIEDALHDLKTAPGRPSVIVADEAQDLSRLQLALLRQWGHNAEYLLMAMDDDQTIYVFTGASP